MEKHPNKIFLDNSFLIIICGLPSSGKSIFAKKLKDSLDSTFYYHLDDEITSIVDTDLIRINNFGGIFNPEHESHVRNMVLIEIKKLLKKNKIVIHDDINYFKSMRHESFKIAEKLQKLYFIIYIITPLKVCLDWNSKRKKSIDKNIITKIAEKFDIPGKKYEWDKPFHSINLSKNNIDNEISIFLKKIQESLSNSVGLQKKKSNEIHIKSKSFIDVITRKLLGIYSEFIQHSSNVDRSDIINRKILNLIENDPQISKMFENILEKYSKSIQILNNLRRKFVESYSIKEQSKQKFDTILYKLLEFLLKS